MTKLIHSNLGIKEIIAKYNEVEEVIIHTGQHYDANMSAVFFEEMQIPEPKYNLNINGLGHGAMTGQMMEEIEKVLLIEKPDAVVVFGDTNSTIAGALTAKKLHIKVIHIEAGLRSFNIQMPEEVNRIVTDRISDLLTYEKSLGRQLRGKKMAIFSNSGQNDLKEGFTMPFIETAKYLGMAYLGNTHI